MHILIAADKFKGSLSASDVCQALKEGICSVNARVTFTLQPLADGGDGSLALLDALWSLDKQEVEVHDPLFRKHKAYYLSKHDTAFIELPIASGMALLSKEARNPMETTTLGTGELILDAYHKGFKKINLFIGGSSTTDAATGIASALGYTFLDEAGNLLSPIGKNLKNIYRIKSSKLARTVRQLEFKVICDVTNPFSGPKGAARVYARQKGANDAAIEWLEEGLQNINELFMTTFGVEVQNIPGAGAAGGVGGGMIAFLDAEKISGTDLFLDLFNMQDKVEKADLVITGEGRFDQQSLDGKVIAGVERLCRDAKKPLIVVCGDSSFNSPSELPFATIKSIETVISRAGDLDDAMKNGREYLVEIGRRIGMKDEG